MRIATTAMSGDRRFAAALIASAMAHALAFHVLGDLRPRASASEVPMPLEVRLLRPADQSPLAVAPPAPRADAPPSSQPLPRVAAPKPQAKAVPRRVEPVLRARETEPANTVAAVPSQEAPPTAEPASAVVVPEVAAVAEAPPRAAEPAFDRLALQARYGRDLEGAVDAAKSYPRIARERGWQGTVKLRVRFLPGGSLGQVEVVDSSGFAVLDEHALRMVRAAELPPIPGGLAAAAFELDVPIRFRLRS